MRRSICRIDMDRKSFFILGLAGFAAWVYYQKSQMPDVSSDVTDFTSDPLASISEAIVSNTIGWKSTGQAAQWLPDLNAAELQFGIPQDLLARIAYQESRFRPDIISGVTASSAGALGIMQLMPQYFASVRVARPFTIADVQAQIEEAAQLLVANFNALGSWPQAVAAYNAGLHTVQSGNASAANKAATANYVAAIIADVPGANA
jgi:soluble lytic murein transglycosylase-like protein